MKKLKLEKFMDLRKDVVFKVFFSKMENKDLLIQFILTSSIQHRLSQVLNI